MGDIEGRFAKMAAIVARMGFLEKWSGYWELL